MKLLTITFSIIMILSTSNIDRQSNESDQPGFRARVIYASLKAAKMNEKLFDRLLDKPGRGTKAMSPEKFHRKLTLEERNVEGFRVLTVRGSRATNNHIILLHGGAYTAEAMGGHRILMEKLALQYHFTVSFIDYPLAPEYDAAKCLRVTEDAYILLTKTYRSDSFFLIGDSAGGGLALALLQQLRNRHNYPAHAEKSGIPTNSIAIPKKNILLSPWLDVSMSNPEIEDYRSKDVLLHVEGLKACGKLYAGDKELDDPMVSPLFGNLENLGNLQVYVSTHELFYPDCLLLAEKAQSANGTSVQLCVREKLLHDWAILPIRERDETIDALAGFLLN